MAVPEIVSLPGCWLATMPLVNECVRRSQDQHAIAVTEEAVANGYGFFVRAHGQVVSGKRGDQHQQAGAA